MKDKSLFGITYQPVNISNNRTDAYVICKYDGTLLEYWNSHNKQWVKSILNATLWPEDKDGEIPYLKNNVYSRFEGFTAGDYKLVGISAGLYPCTIKYHDLYLKSYNGETTWTNKWQDCLFIQGPYKAIEIMWGLLYEKDKVNKTF